MRVSCFAKRIPTIRAHPLFSCPCHPVFCLAALPLASMLQGLTGMNTGYPRMNTGYGMLLRESLDAARRDTGGGLDSRQGLKNPCVPPADPVCLRPPPAP